MLKLVLLLSFSILTLFTGCNRPKTSIPISRHGVISLLPSLTETVCALGLKDSLIAVSSYCNYPPSVVDSLPKMGACINPNIEEIFKLRPSLVLLGDMQVEAAQKISALKIPVLQLPQSRIADVFAAINVLGKRFNVEKKADSLSSAMRFSLDSLQSLHNAAPRKRVLLVVGREPGTLSNVFSVNHESFLAELLQIAGGISIFHDMSEVWCKVSMEEILRRNPDYIIETDIMGGTGGAEEAWKAMPTIKAVRLGQVSTLHESYLFTPGPRMVETARRLSSLLGVAE